ncbi:sn-glycerol-3-phosphate ABC transporter ATP-binding protein UgpC [Devosia sp. 63-57]|uniref:ABC transporter ATP-binding protein n=1 Tax=Devosia sp. 63-57 TaxID=1895751 RepID=UPI00086C4EB0|nr:sn-glycerol-3-phosphate ABC transporter ATP-binding protein UgpC [Devosia sp. 63-57]ODT47902.1 MAG: ABC transporter ATP-binding protein [Pelagibacterium sp. SCN 63-126]ODU87872.1 MAG: ABC transporter ATP-binding protein [Pelagibacterium sp. SCN 63-17]OJX42387.1 MAG: ABC transporter ATP-binding protein [Devosia sp. 63-57]
MSQLSLKRLEKSFNEARIIKGIDLEVSEGEFVVFVGPSGCGKSTLLRMIAGLEDVSSGQIEIGGKAVNDLPPVQRGIAMVFQSYALYPHMSVYENIAFPLRVEKLPQAEVDKRVSAAAKVLQLESRLQHRPGQLSGGQRQRVAIGRAIVRQPKIFLFDEPLSNLDAALRSEMRIELMELHKRLGSTMIYVTHDQVEAMTMADKIVVLDAGTIAQVGSPLDLYHKPDNLFVAGFIGSPKMNFISGKVRSADGTRAVVDLGSLGTIELPRSSTAIAGEDVTLGIRPEHLTLGEGDFALETTPNIVEQLGIHTITYSTLPGGEHFTALFEGNPDLVEGKPVRMSFAKSRVHLFDAKGLAVY